MEVIEVTTPLNPNGPGHSKAYGRKRLPLDEAGLQKQAQINALKGIMQDFIEFDGDFDLELPDLGPEVILPGQKSTCKRI